MSDQSKHKYDNAFLAGSVYEHALDLLADHISADAAGAVLLDLACGFGHIAEPATERFGIEYVGVDLDESEMNDLMQRGQETHSVDLGASGLEDALREILNGRRLAAVTFLDGLEHLSEGGRVLAAISKLLSEHNAVLVVSVPNVTHIDLGIKTLLGNWQYTPSGLLDNTHLTLYSAQSLEGAFAAAGMTCVGKQDFLLAKSDQFFPPDHAGLSPWSSFGHWVREIRSAAEPHSMVNQFVWALMPATSPVEEADPNERNTDLFLSVIMRTQGRRLQELREALLCLASQTNQDFEVLLIAHRTTVADQADIKQILDDQPKSLRGRIRLVLLDRGSRAAPLNEGLREARGRYTTVLDDDDIVTGNWVEKFAEAELTTPGRILRVASLRQDHEVAEVRGVPVTRATGAPIPMFATDFYMAQHIASNQSPQGSWAFPRSLHLDFGIEFDESMTTTEDWEVLLRSAEIAGVTDIPEVTFIYRWWRDRESSRTAHSSDEWMANQHEIERRIDSKPLLLPAGETQRLREDILELNKLRNSNKMMERRINRLRRRVAVLESQANRPPRLASIRRRLKIGTRTKRLLGR